MPLITGLSIEAASGLANSPDGSGAIDGDIGSLTQVEFTDTGSFLIVNLGALYVLASVKHWGPGGSDGTFAIEAAPNAGMSGGYVIDAAAAIGGGSGTTIVVTDPTPVQFVRWLYAEASGDGAVREVEFQGDVASDPPEAPDAVGWSGSTVGHILLVMPELPVGATNLTLQQFDGNGLNPWTTVATGLGGGDSYDFEVEGLHEFSFRAVAVGSGGSTNGPETWTCPQPEAPTLEPVTQTTVIARVTPLNGSETFLVDFERDSSEVFATDVGNSGPYGGDQPSAIDEGLEPESEHFYRVQAHDTAHDISIWSETSSVTTEAIPNEPPVAAFTHTESGLTTTVTDTSADSDGTIIGALFNFGDGTPSVPVAAAGSASHIYEAAGTYTVRNTVTDNDSATSYIEHSITVGTTPLPPETPHPFRGTFENTRSTSHGVRLPSTLPERATGIRVYRKLLEGDTFVAIGDGTAGGLVLSTGLTADTEYIYALKPFGAGGFGDFGDEWGIRTRLVDSGSLEPPDQPNPPGVAKATPKKFVLSEPAWDENEDHPTAFMILEREGYANPMHTWVSPSLTFDDIEVEWFQSYRWRVLSGNSAGSTASEWTPFYTMQSDTCVLAWVTPPTPATAATVSGKEDLRFTTVDSTGDTSGQAVEIGGMNLSPSPEKLAGTLQNGTWQAADWDSRNYASGSTLLRAIAVGSDGLKAKVDRFVTLLNTLATGVRYVQTGWLTNPPVGLIYDKAELSLENLALYPLTARQYWVRSGVTTNSDKVVDWSNSGVTPEAKAAAFELLQPVVLNQAQVGSTPTRTQMMAVPSLAPAGNHVFWVQQWNPKEVVAALETGLDYVADILPNDAEGTGKYLVFARNVDGSGAKLFALDGETFEEFLDFAAAPYNAPDAISVAFAAGVLYVVRPGDGGEVFAIDFDSGQSTLNLKPRQETRVPKFAVGIGSKVVWIFTDDSLPEKTAAHSYEPGNSTPLWTLTDEATLAWAVPDTESLYIALGAKMYVSEGLGTPALEHTFAADIQAFGEDYVGLADDTLWIRTDAGWVLATTILAAGGEGILSVGVWNGKRVAGYTSAQLVEQLDEAGLVWASARTLEPPSEVAGTISRITALQEFLQNIAQASGTEGEADFVPAVVKRKLLIGTGDSGLLLLLELSSYNETNGCFLASKVDMLNLDPYTTLAPTT